MVVTMRSILFRLRINGFDALTVPGGVIIYNNINAYNNCTSNPTATFVPMTDEQRSKWIEENRA